MGCGCGRGCGCVGVGVGVGVWVWVRAWVRVWVYECLIVNGGHKKICWLPKAISLTLVFSVQAWLYLSIVLLLSTTAVLLFFHKIRTSKIKTDKKAYATNARMLGVVVLFPLLYTGAPARQ